jgi:hypothetical protein
VPCNTVIMLQVSRTTTVQRRVGAAAFGRILLAALQSRRYTYGPRRLANCLKRSESRSAMSKLVPRMTGHRRPKWRLIYITVY